MSATKVRNKAVECYNRSDGDLDEAFRLWLEAFPFYEGDVETRRLSREIFDQIIHYKDTTLPSSSRSKTSRVRPGDSVQVSPSLVKTQSAKNKGASAKRRKAGAGDSGRGGSGSRRKRTHRHIRKLCNKKTLRKNR